MNSYQGENCTSVGGDKTHTSTRHYHAGYIGALLSIFMVSPTSFAQIQAEDIFQPMSLFAAEQGNPVQAQLVDINADGSLDMVASVVREALPTGAESSVFVAFNNGTKVPFGRETDYLTNAFDVSTDIVVHRESGGRGLFHVADVNGDGRPDILTGDRVTRVFLNSGVSPFFGSGTEVASVDFDNIHLVDLDNDGDLDQVQPVDGGGLVMLLNEGGAGAFGPFGQPVAISSNRTFNSFVTGDINDDGFLDIVAGGPSGAYFVINRGGVTPFSLGSVAFSIGIDRFPNVVFGLSDIDSDEDLDLLLYEQADGDEARYPYYVLNGGSGELFSSAQAVAIGQREFHSCIDHLLVDTNADAAVDLIITDCEFEQKLVFLNEDTDLPFSPDSVPLPIDADATWLHFEDGEDIDGDGDVDFVGIDASADSSRFALLLNNGFKGRQMPVLRASAEVASEDGASVDIVVSLEQALTYPVKAQLGTIDGTAQQGKDFYGTFEQLEFAAGETQKVVRIIVLEDNIVEPDEHFYARIAFADGANVETPLTKITIVDSAVYPRRSIRIDNTSAKESDGRMNFKISLSGPYQEDISVYAATGVVVNGAEPGKDYYGRSERITFAAGETEKIFSVTVLEDNLIESPERLKARIFNSTSNADISDKAVAIGVIDGSAPPQVYFSKPIINSSERVIRFFTTVYLTAPAVEPLTVSLATKAVSAEPGRDYYGMFQTLKFAPGERSINVLISVVDDSEIERTEAFALRLFKPSAGLKLGKIRRQRINIVDND